MRLTLKEKTKKFTKTQEPYYELWFEYVDCSKKVRYWVWSYIHNKVNNLSHVWETTESAVVGETYNIHFKKANIDERLQFIIHVFDSVNKPITFID